VVIYFVEPAGKAPTVFPGHLAGSSHHRTRHAATQWRWPLSPALGDHRPQETTYTTIESDSRAAASAALFTPRCCHCIGRLRDSCAPRAGRRRGEVSAALREAGVCAVARRQSEAE